MSYVDGFVLCVPRANLEAYKKLAHVGGKVWLEHGALQYKECVAEDETEFDHCISFRTLAKPKDDEVVVFAFITFRDRAHRDAVNAKVMADPRLTEGCDPNNMPFDCQRMAYGGFEAMVEY
jgi:uncharacterized protein YbaA (DUF1428 family)